eukprot:XP_001701348.1 predicted protein [Chlamydomonas reinhardtii]
MGRVEDYTPFLSQEARRFTAASLAGLINRFAGVDGVCVFLPRGLRLLPVEGDEEGPGYRLGWITAPQPLVGKLANWIMASTVGPCSVSQVGRARGGGGVGAMSGKRGVPDVAAVLDDLVAARVVAVPGAMFATRGLQATVAFDEDEEGGGSTTTPIAARHAAAAPATATAPSPCLRLSFAGSSPQQLEEGMRRLAAAAQQVAARRAVQAEKVAAAAAAAAQTAQQG